MNPTQNIKKGTAIFTLATLLGMSLPLVSTASSSTNLQDEKNNAGYSVVTSSQERTMAQLLIEKAEHRGTVRVITDLKLGGIASEAVPGSKEHDEALRSAITEVQKRVLESLSDFHVTHVKRFSFTPGMAMEVDAPTLKALLANPDVHGIREDIAVPPTF